MYSDFKPSSFLCHIGLNGYKYGSINKKPVLAHRIIWKMQYGYDPQHIDHINGNRADNRIENLRSVNRFENLRNMRIGKANTSGVMGVWVNKRGVYVAEIYTDGKKKSLGHFDTIEAAAQARKEAEVVYGFHRNHGKLRGSAL